jgi:hypothetical protein
LIVTDVHSLSPRYIFAYYTLASYSKDITKED